MAENTDTGEKRDAEWCTNDKCKDYMQPQDGIKKSANPIDVHETMAFQSALSGMSLASEGSWDQNMPGSMGGSSYGYGAESSRRGALGGNSIHQSYSGGSAFPAGSPYRGFGTATPQRTFTSYTPPGPDTSRRCGLCQEPVDETDSAVSRMSNGTETVLFHDRLAADQAVKKNSRFASFKLVETEGYRDVLLEDNPIGAHHIQRCGDRLKVRRAK
ncbi:hypothetical protein IAR55_004761 [Kwoniella newhampshirensis]|uniref:Uncharacterized protein n=1 Tax=Kwoniella newhampshirensis TaxID=1651941 RepID=A0AAW0YWQ9_9TREE